MMGPPAPQKSIFSQIGDIASTYLNPVGIIGGFMDQFNQGQARDEARTIRQEDMARDQRNFDAQMDFNKNEVTNRINQGLKAGLSLSAAAGLQGGGGGAVSSPVGQDTNYLNTQGGQAYDPLMKRQGSILDAQLEGLKLDNLKKMQDLEKPAPHISKTGANNFVKSGGQVVASVDSARQPGKDPNNILDYSYVEGQDSGYYVVPSEMAKERSEDNFVQERMWDWRNYAKPFLKNQPPPPPQVPLKKGMKWTFSPMQAAWFQVPIDQYTGGTNPFKNKNQADWLEHKYPNRTFDWHNQDFSYRDSTGKLHKTKSPGFNFRKK